jgi:1-aminocyclopropane-1-carboxylate synthase
MQGHVRCASEPFGSSNLKGYINMGIAENHLMADEWLPYVNSNLELIAPDLQYFELSGIESSRIKTSQFLKKEFHPDHFHPEGLVFMNGLSSVCECLSYCLFNEGDYLMIPTPYYPGFEFDFQKRFGVNFLRVHLDRSNNFKHDIQRFIETYEAFENKEKIKAILITNPHNPTGEIIQSSFLKDIVAFAKDKKLELIVDEVYALTKFNDNSFSNIYNHAGDYAEHIHWMYGLAKDFTLAGFKTGIFWSNNQKLVGAMKALSYFHCIPSWSHRFLEKLFGDEVFTKYILEKSHQRLSLTKARILNELTNTKVIHGNSGLFFLLDLTAFLREKTFDFEIKLFFKLLDEYKIFLTPGQAMGMKEPGYFRLCFAREEEILTEFLKRFKKFINSEPNF